MLAQAGGYDLILACRNEAKGNEAVEKLKSKVPDVSASFMKLDLASLKSIHEFVDAFHATGKPLHVLINNAGLACDFKDTTVNHTEDGFELTFGTNHLGHFLLTNLLIEDLKQTASKDGEARVVIVSSELHDPKTVNHRMRNDIEFPFEFDNLQFEKAETYNGLRAYGNSKLANVFFMHELARRVEGSGVTATALNPGFIPDTELLRGASGWSKFMLRNVLYHVLRLFNVTRTLDHGSGMIFDLATKPEYKGVTGKYFNDYQETEPSEESRDTEKAKKLWDVSADLVKYQAAKDLRV
ncbi:putative short-chain dehydrogenase TIC 32, chloroplastic [Apostichopus japonicus]|uniref:Putative short-chain dehydrogenase TIC 32, chloroplastic n=1 Tax=Stichopus japonicus TaxID=307972 RepID=A0A2G8LFZ9_STIJA|nr:putative short-chain dehydrogenase TIC 32, chloroplastic [Apostichopus japonicus]